MRQKIIDCAVYLSQFTEQDRILLWIFLSGLESLKAQIMKRGGSGRRAEGYNT